jgi:ribonuclease R
VHRSLIQAYDLGPGGLEKQQEVQLEQICEDISACERTSMEAERNSIDRFCAAYLSSKLGAQFSGRISGVTRFGLFIKLEESGADGIVPIRSLPQDFYVHDERSHALVGRRTARIFRLGAPVTVVLMEADGLSGSTVLELVGHDHGADIPGMTFKKPHFRENRHEKRKKYGKKDRRGGKKHGKDRGKKHRR